MNTLLKTRPSPPKKRLSVLLVALVLLMLILSLPVAAFGAADGNDLSAGIEDVADNLDVSGIEQYVADMDVSAAEMLGLTSVKDYLKKVITGDAGIGYDTLLSYMLTAVKDSALKFLPLMLAVVAVAIAASVLDAMKGSFASESVSDIVHFACIGVVLVLLFAQFAQVAAGAGKIITDIKRQSEAFFPVILTLMTAAGAGASAGVYQPGVLVLTSGIITLVSAVALPMFLLSAAFTAVGNLTGAVNLKNLSGFFLSACKWLLTTAFFVYIAFLSVQGITASVYDGISVRTAKFALSKYVPVIGGYLSEGFNTVMAGSVLIKNSVGLTAIVILLVTVAPFIINLCLLSLSLKLAGAIAEPLGNGRTVELLNGMSQSIGVLAAIILGLAFLYFIMLLLVITTGNIAL